MKAHVPFKLQTNGAPSWQPDLKQITPKKTWNQTSFVHRNPTHDRQSGGLLHQRPAANKSSPTEMVRLRRSCSVDSGSCGRSCVSDVSVVIESRKFLTPNPCHESHDQGKGYHRSAPLVVTKKCYVFRCHFKSSRCLDSPPTLSVGPVHMCEELECPGQNPLGLS